MSWCTRLPQLYSDVRDFPMESLEYPRCTSCHIWRVHQIKLFCKMYSECNTNPLFRLTLRTRLMYLFHHGGSITTKSYSSSANFSISDTQLLLNLQFGGMRYVSPDMFVRIAVSSVFLPFTGTVKAFSLDTSLNTESDLLSF